MKRKILSLLLAMAMVCSLVPPALAAVGGGVTVRVVSEAEGSELSLGPFEAAYSEGMSAWDAVKAALDENAVPYEFSDSHGSVYISSINGLAEYSSADHATYYGWMFAVDCVVPATGISLVTLSGGEDILLYYSTDFTIPGAVSGSGGESAEGLSFSAGELTSAPAAGGTLLTLSAAEGVTGAVLTGVPGGANQSVQVNYADYDLSHPGRIPLSDGGVIAVSVGVYPDTVYYNVNVSIRPQAELLSSLARGYDGRSASWTAVDLASYGLYAGTSPFSANAQAVIDDAVTAVSAQVPDDAALAKSFLDLRALGVDPDALLCADGTVLSVTDALMDSTTNSCYSAPYVLLALEQSGKASAEKMSGVLDVMEAAAGDDFLFSYSWGGVTYPSPDTAGAVLAAVSLCAGSESDPHGIRGRCAALRDGILNALAEDSLQDRFGSYGNSCTDAMVLIGLCAAGVDPAADARYTTEGGSPYTALLSCAKKDGFSLTPDKAADDFSTEQCFRALTAAARFLKGEAPCNVYDFTAFASAPGYASNVPGCPVIFSTTPAGAEVSLTLGGAPVEPLSPGRYSLVEGTYSYSVSAGGYAPKTGTLTVSAQDAYQHKTLRVSVSLISQSGGSGNITVSFTLVGDSLHGSGTTHIYKNDKGAGRIWLSEREVSLPSGSSAFAAFDQALSDAGLTYVEPSFNYISSVTNTDGTTLSELDNGALSGWQYLVNGTSPATGCRNYTLRGGDRVVFYYTDDYTRETGSEQWSGGGSTSVSGSVRFEDVDPDSAYAKAIEAMAEAGYMNGTGEKTFSPDEELTRSQAVAVLWRMAGSPDSTAPSTFSDSAAWYSGALNWAADQRIALGYGDGCFHGGRPVSTRELRDFLCRWAVWKGRFQTLSEAEAWAGQITLPDRVTRAAAAAAFDDLAAQVK
ncbi:DUF4430 domain-containing protein [Oscillibacter sp. MSJ-2]|uniref:DUF4430 domain-containing protein n=1 Tax=Dysosmobacter acutus TaxID=2841504 RepID=A0ABS6F8T5_9FIRM|nr:DUF4430 domain-containing protein [Dysosmobacter acutus]MBU5625987.1 DUF4430 domain-containing protein [Dysosmobacter acutus]